MSYPVIRTNVSLPSLHHRRITPFSSAAFHLELNSEWETNNQHGSNRDYLAGNWRTEADSNKNTHTEQNNEMLWRVRRWNKGVKTIKERQEQPRISEQHNAFHTSGYIMAKWKREKRFWFFTHKYQHITLLAATHSATRRKYLMFPSPPLFFYSWRSVVGALFLEVKNKNMIIGYLEIVFRIIEQRPNRMQTKEWKWERNFILQHILIIPIQIYHP